MGQPQKTRALSVWRLKANTDVRRYMCYSWMNIIVHLVEMLWTMNKFDDVRAISMPIQQVKML